MPTETNFNRKKQNYKIQKRRKDRMKKASHGQPTVDAKVARQKKLLERRERKQQEKKALKEGKMQIDK
ncbi:UNKNOWN [Stylonychia lemnae]|uniref:Uncharacterized protein n=1 Tax=Stylonychia lemnae TaxID=5949 RepID=A0A078AZM5_STYLE|nr:UNKNOWN [Stylonychia lemnae]|eukprot:CDW86258.1 UNKNOWN [Stylonychia lemnae]